MSNWQAMSDYEERAKVAHELTRRQLWMDTYVAVAGSANCNNKNVPAQWADQALKDYDERFYGHVRK